MAAFDVPYWHNHLKQYYVCIINVTVWAKPAIFTYELKFILLPQLIATLNNYACSPPPLANVNWSASPECFSSHVNPWLVKWHQWRAPIWQWAHDITPTVSTCLSWNIGPLWVHVDVIATINFTIVSSSFLFSLCHHPPAPTPLAHPFIYTDPILLNYIKIVKN